MGKIRVAKLGDEELEKKLKRKAEARREAKKAKKLAETVPEAPDQEVHPAEHAVEAPETDKKTKPEKKTGSEGKRQPKVRSKKYQEMIKLVDRNKLYPLDTAVELVKQTSLTSFDGTVEAHVNLNPNAMDGKTDLRGTVNLPHGTGKTVRVAVADDKLIAEVAAGTISFDVLVAHPSIMPKLAKVARILGPKGLMPNPKNGTVTTEVDKKVLQLKKGQVNYKSEPNNPIVHLPVGKVSFDKNMLTENIKVLIQNIGINKILKLTLTSTMGPGVKVDLS